MLNWLHPTTEPREPRWRFLDADKQIIATLEWNNIRGAYFDQEGINRGNEFASAIAAVEKGLPPEHPEQGKLAL